MISGAEGKKLFFFLIPVSPHPAEDCCTIIQSMGQYPPFSLRVRNNLASKIGMFWKVLHQASSSRNPGKAYSPPFDYNPAVKRAGHPRVSANDGSGQASANGAKDAKIFKGEGKGDA